MTFGPKALDCLCLAALPDKASPEWQLTYELISQTHSAKAVRRKLEELYRRRYVHYDGNPLAARLTAKGRKALTEALPRDQPD